MAENKNEQFPKIQISLKTNSKKERKTQQTLEQVLAKYPLNKWIVCRDVVIEEGARGKSHPVIRLSAWEDGEYGLLAQFLHEQIHWIEDKKHEVMDEAIGELKDLFPSVQTSLPEGAVSEKSTYRHLIVCRFEFLVLVQLLGEKKAEETILKNRNYTWIRKMAIEKGPVIDEITQKYFPETFKKLNNG